MQFIETPFSDLTTFPELNKDYLGHIALSGCEGIHQQKYFGQGIYVGVLDTGVNPNHPELLGRVTLLNALDYGNGSDDMGHGTHVAGTIAGKNVGIAPESHIVSIKVLDGTGSAEIEQIIKGLQMAKEWRSSDNKKLSLVSMSLSVPEGYFQYCPNKLQDFHNVIQALVKDNIAVICSAGNTGKSEVRYPAAFQEPITVGAVDIDTMQPAGFSTSNPEVDLCQAGVNILSAHYKGGYSIMSGTSMSTPNISGQAALIACKYLLIRKQSIPEMLLYEILKFNSKDIGAFGIDPKTGVGFCSFQPVKLDMYTREGDRYIINNGKNIPIDTQVVTVEGRTMLPLRATAEQLGFRIGYDPETNRARCQS